MKTLLYSLVFMLITANDTLAQSRFIPGEKVNVWAPAGLSLNSAPGLKSKSLTTIPYGQPVQVIKQTGRVSTATIYFPDGIKMKKPYQLKGQWTKVVYKGLTGYVFDGYLSKMIPVHTVRDGDFETAQAYFKRNYGMLKIVKNNNQSDEKKISTYYKNSFRSIETSGDGCFEETLYLKNMTSRESLLFALAVYFNGDAISEVKFKSLPGNVITIYSFACD